MKKKWKLKIGMIHTLMIWLFLLTLSNAFVTWRILVPEEIEETTNPINSFARCLSEKGFVMYGSQYCGYCAKQKELFGDSFNLVNYVECTEQQGLCREKNITGVPTWIYPNDRLSGVQSLEKLSELSNCEL